MRAALLWILVLSYFGLGLCDCWMKNWRTGVASLLLGVIQLLIFWK